ncbi:UDP-N-acetylglucosamine transferase subunit ALG14 homolog isoform X2 [Scyliorhinus canicula]|uniref:UDP-N-acetylglucosamine transferase subunit ALG14 homolog isoform X2 n=1 Tax=Scyliorhinus canicula TaxID=7830 RepID=UPI0018F29F13|nr:UDP-N-acetylglucosamine transferase subunit ALG14 homolog isoform X2 [Scyliorhinus canicula]
MDLCCGTGAALFALGCILVASALLVLRRNGAGKAGGQGAVSVLVVLGSGGHTTEILRLVDSLSASYAPRHYVIANTDMMSAERVRILEAARSKGNTEPQVLCNGPGTCVPLCISALMLRILGMKKVLIIYIESICRVETLSLSGKILYNLSDYFFVQWSALQKKYPKAIYLGRLV